MATEYKEKNIKPFVVLQLVGKGVVNVKQYNLVKNGNKTEVEVITSVDEMYGKSDLKQGVRHLSVYCAERTPSIRELYEAKFHFTQTSKWRCI